MSLMIIPAAGRASRMNLPPGSPTKCLLPVEDGPLIDGLVRPGIEAGLTVRVLARPGDLHMRRWSLRHGSGDIEIIDAPLEPYGTTILRALRDDSQALVSDSDLLLPPGEMEAFLRRCGRAGTGLTVGVTGEPWDLGPRTLWWDPGSTTRRIGRGLTGARARLAGVYWFRPRAVRRLRAFVAAGGISFATFLTEYPADDVDGFSFSYSFNINTRDDMAAARDRAADERRRSHTGGGRA